MTLFFSWKIIRAITHEIEHVEKSFQVVTYSTLLYWTHIQHNNHDVIIVEVTMIFQKFINLEINETLMFSVIFGNTLKADRKAFHHSALQYYNKYSLSFF